MHEQMYYVTINVSLIICKPSESTFKICVRIKKKNRIQWLLKVKLIKHDKIIGVLCYNDCLFVNTKKYFPFL